MEMENKPEIDRDRNGVTDTPADTTNMIALYDSYVMLAITYTVKLTDAFTILKSTVPL